MSDRWAAIEPEPDGEMDSLFERLRWLAPPAPFAPAEAVRQRARQRTRRQAGMAGAAVAVVVLAVGGVGAGVLDSVRAAHPAGVDVAAEGSPSPTAPEPTSRPTEVPPQWLLSGADLGPQWRPTTHELFEDDPAWFWSGRCGPEPAREYRSLVERLDFAVASWQDTSTSESRRVDHVLELFATPAAAAAQLEDVKLVIESCGVPPSSGEGALILLEIADSGFAGDGSLLVIERAYFYEDEERAAEPYQRLIAVVRADTTVSTIIFGGEHIDNGEQDIREVARLVASLVG